MQRAHARQVKNLLLGVYLSISQRLAGICRFSALEDDLMVVTGGDRWVEGSIGASSSKFCTAAQAEGVLVTASASASTHCSWQDGKTAA